MQEYGLDYNNLGQLFVLLESITLQWQVSPSLFSPWFTMYSVPSGDLQYGTAKVRLIPLLVAHAIHNMSNFRCIFCNFL